MKLEHYIFLSLILAAAIITGSTLGVAANLPYILEQAEKNQVLQLAAQEKAAEKAELSAAAASPVEISRGSTSTADVMVITAAEKEHILDMLKSLGMADEADLSAFIKSFQEKHALDATGVLDSKTLHFIMQEAKLVTVYTRQASLN